MMILAVVFEYDYDNDVDTRLLKMSPIPVCCDDDARLREMSQLPELLVYWFRKRSGESVET